jgi:hypothetical protein
LGLKRERLDSPLKPVATPSRLNAHWLSELHGEQGRLLARYHSPIDVDWEKHLFYICSPVSGLPFASLRRSGEWVGKIRNLAVAQPFETRGDPEEHRLRFDDHLFDGTAAALTSLKEMRVVCLPIRQPNVDGDGWDWEEADRSSLIRHGWGHVAIEAYLSEKSAAVETRRIGSEILL